MASLLPWVFPAYINYNLDQDREILPITSSILKGGGNLILNIILLKWLFGEIFWSIATKRELNVLSYIHQAHQ